MYVAICILYELNFLKIFYLILFLVPVKITCSCVSFKNLTCKEVEIFARKETSFAGLSMGMSFLWESHGKRPMGWDSTHLYFP